MLLRVDSETKSAERVTGSALKKFDLDERGLQQILFQSLDRLIGDDELLPIAQSRHWQEEPDLLAVDRDGNLYIFEIKVWEARQENLLQVLRYGQLNGPLDYDRLDSIWRRTRTDERSLSEAHEAKFEIKLSSDKFNQKQIFVVLTNGLDVETRQAVQYWRTTGLDIRPWVYRVYEFDSKMVLEISPFRTRDDPLEDQAESQGENYYIVNTNRNNDDGDDRDMIRNKKVAAYYEPWKYKIARLKKNDHVFLYRSGSGIVAFGKADGKLVKTRYHGNPKESDQEYYMGLRNFELVDPAITAANIKLITENPGLVFRQTMFSLDQKSGENLYKVALERSKR